MEIPDILMHAVAKLAEEIDTTLKEQLGAELAKIIQTHALLGAAAGAIPVPGVDLAALTANTWTMYVRINKAANLPFSEHAVKSVALGIGTNLLSTIPALLFAATAGSIVKFVPGLGTFAGMVADAAAYYATTLVAAFFYVKMLTMLIAQKRAFTDDNLRQVAEEVKEDRSFKDEMKQTFKAAKEGYKDPDKDK
jgi:uncharacterized protein (DUF697 family)